MITDEMLREFCDCLNAYQCLGVDNNTSNTITYGPKFWGFSYPKGFHVTSALPDVFVTVSEPSLVGVFFITWLVMVVLLITRR